MTLKKLRTALFILLFSLSAPALCLALNVQEFMLDNGLKVLILEDHKAPTATFQVWYRVGARDEEIGKTGLSHLLEHMMFKGTPTHGPKTFSQTIQRAGGWDNAFTTEEYTGYYEFLASDRIWLPVELEADRMRNLILTPQAVMSERDVVMEERRLRYEDDPQNLVYEEVKAAAFKNHPYRWPVIGWMSDLKTLNPDDLVSHYNKYYQPNNAVVIVVGDVDTKEMLGRIKAAFGKIPAGPAIHEEKVREDEQFGEKRIFVKKEAELPYILSVFKTPNFKDPDSSALEVLEQVLSGGKSARLYSALVYEQQVALSAWAGYDSLNKDPAVFFVGATAAHGKTAEEVEQALLREIEKIKKVAPTEQEVQKAKNQIEASFIKEQDSFYMQAKTIGTFEMIGGWRLIDTYLDGVRKVTPEDVRRVAEKYLVADGKTTGILVPLKKKAEEEGRK